MKPYRLYSLNYVLGTDRDLYCDVRFGATEKVMEAFRAGLYFHNVTVMADSPDDAYQSTNLWDVPHLLVYRWNPERFGPSASVGDMLVAEDGSEGWIVESGGFSKMAPADITAVLEVKVEGV